MTAPRNTRQTLRTRELAVQYVDSIYGDVWPDLPAGMDTARVRYEILNSFPSARHEPEIQAWAQRGCADFTFNTYRRDNGVSPAALALAVISFGAGECLNLHAEDRIKRALAAKQEVENV